MKKNNIGPEKARDSYLGGTLKPQLLKQHQNQFNRAVKKEGDIDFSRAEFVSTGEMVKEGSIKTLISGTIPYTVYALNCTVDSQAVSTAQMHPQFAVTQWNGEPKILRLVFKE
ncbi:MAG: hypothetical protein GF350_13170 [Chitinivibrionales bacterium]|nr:hypothetical protein [Chitinivibrionales bacterium]